MRASARSLDSLQGGSDLRNSETTGNLQLLQKFVVSGVGNGKLNTSVKDSLLYVGMQSHVSSLESEKNDKEKKNGQKENYDKKIKENKVYIV